MGLWAFSVVNLVCLHLLGKHKQICFIIPYLICSCLVLLLQPICLTTFIKFFLKQNLTLVLI